jgi:hypothetical protein
MADTNYSDGGIGAIFDFSFKRFITLSVMKVLFGLGLALIALSWLILVIGGFLQGILAGLLGLVVITIMAVVYVIFFRVWLELIVVIFRIGENTSILVEQKRSSAATVTP